MREVFRPKRGGEGEGDFENAGLIGVDGRIGDRDEGVGGLGVSSRFWGDLDDSLGDVCCEFAKASKALILDFIGIT